MPCSPRIISLLRTEFMSLNLLYKMFTVYGKSKKERTNIFLFLSADSRKAVVNYWRKDVLLVLVNRLGGLSLPRNRVVRVVRLIDRPDMTIAVYHGRKATKQQGQIQA